jgi:hypothetical protein
LAGLAPARSSACPRCGTATLAFANGRGRVDICHKCGIAEASTAEGLELFSMKGMDPSLRKPRGP